MYKILVADDEARIRDLIKKYAEFEGHAVYEAADGMQAVRMCHEQEFDIIIMDIMMPELDGFSACREIRRFSQAPILMLSARGEEYDKIHGFESDIDDYVVKPFSPRELMLRIQAILKRSNSQTSAPLRETLSFGGLTIDFSARTVLVDGKRAEMTPKEHELLFYLVKNRGLAMTREQLISNVWGYDFYGDERTLDTHIKMLRKNLGPYSHLIATLRGVGYRFDEQ